MAINRVDYAGQTLIDLTLDTITEDKLLFGITAHNASGSIITGTFLQDFPNMFVMEDTLMDSTGNGVLDHSLKNVLSRIIYAKK